MNINLLLFGNLKTKIRSNNITPGSPVKINLNTEEKIYTIYDILKKFGLEENEISHIFVNGKYCGMGTILHEGDRVGIFPKNMGLIFAEIEKNNSIRIRIQLPKNIEEKFNRSEAFLSIPMGSNLRYLLKKLNILDDFNRLQIFVNENRSKDLASILKEGDQVKIVYS